MEFFKSWYLPNFRECHPPRVSLRVVRQNASPSEVGETGQDAAQLGDQKYSCHPESSTATTQNQIHMFTNSHVYDQGSVK
jgi:hypothetical protein